MKNFHAPAPQRGVSLIEACIGLAVASIIVTTGVPNLRALIDDRRLDGAANQLAADLRLARSEAVTRNQGIRVAFDAQVEGGCYVLHTGPVDGCSCNATGSAVCEGDAVALKSVVLARAEQVSLQANVGSIQFDPLHGTSTPTATLRITGAGGRSVQHVVNIMGRVRSCSPQGAVSGWRSC